MSDSGKTRAGIIIGSLWTIIAVPAGIILMALHPGQLLAGVPLILSGLASSFFAAPLLQKLGVGGQARVALAVIFAGLAGLSLFQNPPKFPSAKPAPAKTLLEAGGDFGNVTSKSFTTTDAGWTLEWSFDCAGLGDSGNFKLAVVKDNGAPLANGVVEKIGDKDSGSVQFKDAGTFKLQVVSECRWSAVVKG